MVYNYIFTLDNAKNGKIKSKVKTVERLEMKKISYMIKKSTQAKG